LEVHGKKKVGKKKEKKGWMLGDPVFNSFFGVFWFGYLVHPFFSSFH